MFKQYMGRRTSLKICSQTYILHGLNLKQILHSCKKLTPIYFKYPWPYLCFHCMKKKYRNATFLDQNFQNAWREKQQLFLVETPIWFKIINLFLLKKSWVAKKGEFLWNTFLHRLKKGLTLGLEIQNAVIHEINLIFSPIRNYFEDFLEMHLFFMESRIVVIAKRIPIRKNCHCLFALLCTMHTIYFEKKLTM